MRLLIMKTRAKKKGLGHLKKKTSFFRFFFQNIKKACINGLKRIYTGYFFLLLFFYSFSIGKFACTRSEAITPIVETGNELSL